MSAPVFHHTHRITYAECTLGHHVYYSRYLDILEAARGEFFRQLGTTLVTWQEQDLIFPVVECHLRYKSPARYDDVLSIELWLKTLDRVRLSFAYRVLNQSGQLLLEAETLHVGSGLNEKLKRLPDELLAQLRPYVEVDPPTAA